MVRKTKNKRFGIGVAIEMPYRNVFKKDLSRQYYKKFNSQDIYAFKKNSKVMAKRRKKVLLVASDEKCEGMISFKVLLWLGTNLEEVERLVKILNILGDDKLIKDKIKAYMSNKSVLNNLVELNDLKRIFNNLNTLIPNFIENAWFSAPGAKLR